MAGIDSDFLFKLSLEEEQRRKLLMQSLARVNAQRQATDEALAEDEETGEVGAGLLDLSYYADSLKTGEADDPQERLQRAIARAQGAGDDLSASGDALFQNLAASLATFDPNQGL